MSTCQRIAITPGEPAGIGPDICIALAQQSFAHELIFIADIELMRQRAAMLGIELDIHHAELSNDAQPHRSEERRVGKECRRECRSRWTPEHEKKKKES